MSSSTTTNALSAKDRNVPMPPTAPTSDTVADAKKDMEYHRQVLKSKMEAAHE